MAIAHTSNKENFFINSISYPLHMERMEKGGAETSSLDEQR